MRLASFSSEKPITINNLWCCPIVQKAPNLRHFLSSVSNQGYTMVARADLRQLIDVLEQRYALLDEKSSSLKLMPNLKEMQVINLCHCIAY